MATDRVSRPRTRGLVSRAQRSTSRKRVYALQTRDRSSPRRSRISAGMSARAVAAELTKRKIKTPAGGT